MKKLLIFILLFFVSINVYASTKTYDRENLEHFGVNKKWNIDDADMLYYIKKTPAVDASEKVYDFCDILSDDEEKEIYNKIGEYKNKTGFDLVYLSYDLKYKNDLENDDFAADFYDFNDFGIDKELYDGVIFFRNCNSYPYYVILSFGNAQLYYNTERINNILDYIYNDMITRNYMSGFNKLESQLMEYYNFGKYSPDAYVDNNSYIRYHDEYEPVYNFPLVSIIIAFVITLIFVNYHKKKNFMIMKEYKADGYIDKPSIRFTKRENKFIRSATTSHYISSSSGSSFSGGGSHSSHSSGGHSGGGHSGGGRHG